MKTTLTELPTNATPAEILSSGIAAANGPVSLACSFSLEDVAKEYFDSVSAPSKEFVIIPEVGHLAIFTGPDAFLRELVGHARKFAVSK